jgi:uncharacterized protein (TIGR04551 family)
MKIVHIRKILSISICFVSVLLMATASVNAAENAETKDETAPKEDKDAPAKDKLPKPLAANDELEPETEEKKNEGQKEAGEATPTNIQGPTSPPGEIADLKAQIKAEILAEIAAAKDAPTQSDKSQAQNPETWVSELAPQLNFLQIDGYFRTRADLFHRLDLGTFDPLANNGIGRGTSNFPTPTLYRPFDAATCEAEGIEGLVCDTEGKDTNTLQSINMRLRLDPTLNVSEDIRVRSTLDVFDNLVYGSTPEAKPGFAQNPTLPLPLFSANQNPPQEGLNARYDAIRIKRIWAEIMTPFGQLRFGRQPNDFGLGLLANSGNGLDQDYGDNADQILFATKAFGHYIIPAYSLSASGDYGRGGGLGALGDFGQRSYLNEAGQRYNLDPRDDVHSFILSVQKKDNQATIEQLVLDGSSVLNYGVFAVYRQQAYDIPSYYTAQDPMTAASASDYVRRDANAVALSGWALFRWQKLKLEFEVAGIYATINGTSTSSSGLDAYDNGLGLDNDGKPIPLNVFQGGAALESSYLLLNDSLQIGLNAGWASGDDAPGFGLRPVINQSPNPGDADAKQYGRCIEVDDNGDCIFIDDNISNFRFDPDYQVDLILFREILGTVTDAVYVKPHITYFVNKNTGIRADIISSFANYATSTPGNASPLGIELDASAFYQSLDGFHFMMQYGYLFPLAGLNHAVDEEGNTAVREQFAEAQPAQTFQLFFGVAF